MDSQINRPGHVSNVYDNTYEEIFKPEDISRKVGDVSYFFFKSHMASLALKTTIALTFTAAVLTTGFLSTTVPVAVPFVLGFGIVSWLLLDVIKTRKALLFEISLLFTIRSGGHDWCTPITNNIVLGALPLAHHIQMLKDLKVNSVLTLVEEFERKQGLIHPLSKTELESAGIDNLELPSPDFIGVPLETIRKGVEYMHKKITNNDIVYVHCKAGRGRSATLVVAYLLKYGADEGLTFKTVKKAIDFVKKIRPQISLNANQQAAITLYWEKDCQPTNS